jgi:hypothetical protein
MTPCAVSYTGINCMGDLLDLTLLLQAINASRECLTEPAVAPPGCWPRAIQVGSPYQQSADVTVACSPYEMPWLQQRTSIASGPSCSPFQSPELALRVHPARRRHPSEGARTRRSARLASP